MSEEYKQADSPLKSWVIEYVGQKLKPENSEVTVEMVVATLVTEFPEVVLALAEENFLRGYEQAFIDMQAVTEDLIEKGVENGQEE